MSTQRNSTTPCMWPWAAAIAVTTLVCVVMPTLDHIDEQAFSDEQAATLHQLQAQRRQQQHAITVCHRAFGPNTAPAEDVDGNLVCVGKRGQRMAAVQVAAAQQHNK